MDIKPNDVFEFVAGEIKVRILITHVGHDISGKTLDDVEFGPMPAGQFMCFSRSVFDMMVKDGVISKVGHRPKGISYE